MILRIFILIHIMSLMFQSYATSRGTEGGSSVTEVGGQLEKMSVGG